MVQKGEEMIENDNQHNVNIQTLEQMTFEWNKVKSEHQYASASTNTKKTRLEEDLR